MKIRLALVGAMLLTCLMALPAQADANVDGASAPPLRRPPVPGSQRLEWRITELEDEVRVLERLARQQLEAIDQLQSRAELAGRRDVIESIMLGALLGLVSAGAAWTVVHRPRP